MGRDKQGFLQISFSWLFAIIIGAIILFFAIYAAVRLINTGGSSSSAVAGKEVSVLLNPLETGFGAEKSTPMSLPTESRINNTCKSDSFLSSFGEQGISISQKIGGKWSDTGANQVFFNKYIFSNSSIQGKNFYLFSKPLNLPFDVANLIFLTSSEDNYCFINAPDNINQEISGLNQGNLHVSNCPGGSINVCFNPGTTNTKCGIQVNTFDKSVSKQGKTVYYETDSLMYAAIFSDPLVYECQVKRLMERIGELSLIYNKEQAALSSEGCQANVNVVSLAGAAGSLQDSSNLISVKAAADLADSSNKNPCKLW